MAQGGSPTDRERDHLETIFGQYQEDLVILDLESDGCVEETPCFLNS